MNAAANVTTGSPRAAGPDGTAGASAPPGGRTHPRERRTAMLMTIFIILVALWLLGMVSSYTLGGFIHLLLVLAIVVILIRVIQGRSAV